MSSEIKEPLESKYISEYFLTKLFNQILETNQDCFKLKDKRSRVKFSKEALARIRLLQKWLKKGEITTGKIVPIDYNEERPKEEELTIPLSEITYQFAELTGIEKPENEIGAELIREMNLRIMALILRENITPEKIIEVSEKLFGDCKLKNVIKTIYLSARDYSYTASIEKVRENMVKTKNDFIKEEQKTIEKIKSKAEKIINPVEKKRAFEKLKERENELNEIKNT